MLNSLIFTFLPLLVLILSCNRTFSYEFSSNSAPNSVERDENQHNAPPGPSIREFGHFAGYIDLLNTKRSRLFYFFFESRSCKTDPVLIWLHGGPGCSGELPLFYENGPFKITEDMSLVWNDYGWDKVSNLIYVDSPVGVGFSYTTDESDMRYNQSGISNDLYNFLQEFFRTHPQFVENDFYITGESYAGHYVPALASRIVEGNKNKEGIHINLKGFSIGNGLTDPANQYPAYTDFALDRHLINGSEYNRINAMVPGCLQAIKDCGSQGDSACIDAFPTCTNIYNEIVDLMGNRSFFDLRKQCPNGPTCYDYSRMVNFLNEKKVQDAIGVGMKYDFCNITVYNMMKRDWMKNLALPIPALLEEGIRVLIYAGTEDLVCNWLGNFRWVTALEWSGRTQYQAAGTAPFIVGRRNAGELKSYGPLTFLKVYEAGHMVPMDQPKAALQMIMSWMRGTLTNNFRDGYQDQARH